MCAHTHSSSTSAGSSAEGKNAPTSELRVESKFDVRERKEEEVEEERKGEGEGEGEAEGGGGEGEGEREAEGEGWAEEEWGGEWDVIGEEGEMEQGEQGKVEKEEEVEEGEENVGEVKQAEESDMQQETAKKTTEKVADSSEPAQPSRKWVSSIPSHCAGMTLLCMWLHVHTLCVFSTRKSTLVIKHHVEIKH